MIMYEGFSIRYRLENDLKIASCLKVYTRIAITLIKTERFVQKNLNL